MKIVIIATLAALSIAAPQYEYVPPTARTPAPPPPPPPSSIYDTPAPAYGASNRVASVAVAVPVATLRDERVQEEDGTFNVEFEAENGISFSQSGSPDGDDDAVVKSGQYSYTAPDGTFVEVTYVADENGYQPQSDLLPVAPAFPHPIPQFVLDQIAKAAEEDAAAVRAAATAPSNTYSAPPSPQPPRNTYVAPTTPQPPRNAYVAPTTPQTPRNTYVAPPSPQPPRNTYVAPTTPQPPRNTYVAPPSPQPPRNTYVAPTTPQPPRNTYVAPTTPQPPRSVYAFPQ